jgi:hypothetical protein
MMKKDIFTLWWQGMEHAPDIIQICHNSLLRHIDTKRQQLHVLDEKSVHDYVELPGYIMDKHHRGKISTTHLSDIIRSKLLLTYGGLWTDASVFFSRDLDHESLFFCDFFTLKNPLAKPNDITSKWECFFIAGQKDFPLFSLLTDFWLEYWKREDELITYLLTDHIFYAAYTQNTRVKKAMDACPSFHYRIDYFQRLLNTAYDNTKYEEIIKNEPYIKMSYKFPLSEKLSNGAITYYGYLRGGGY